MQQGSIFEDQVNEPLASRLRPENLEQVFGQTHLLGPGKILRELITQDRVTSMILWGPPGVGKTTLAQVIAKQTKAGFISFSAVTSGIKEIKKIMQEAEANTAYGQKTIVFVDEIHRFNKAQQDAFLPFVENGSIVLIGATTENPSFEINSALLSRLKVFVLKQLTKEQLVELLDRACRVGFEKELAASKTLLEQIAIFSDGDARNALNTLEMLVDNGNVSQDGTLELSDDLLSQVLGEKTLKYDKNGEDHYDLISALHKSMRNSDVDAAIYWLNRMLAGGEDPLYIARRLLRFASEDIGMADSRALEIAIAGYQACHFLGYPECDVHLTHVVTYLSLSVKSNALDKAYNKAKKDALETLSLPVPLHLRNAPTKLMKDLDYGKGYQYAHDYEDKITTMTCLPEELLDRVYYEPTQQGAEAKVLTRLNQIKDWKKRHR